MAIGINLDSDDYNQDCELCGLQSQNYSYRVILKRLVNCANNGFNTEELHDIVQAAKGAL